MKNKKHIAGSIILASTVLLSACGSGTSNSTGAVNDNISHPVFNRFKVKSSVSFEPNGEIREINPTFVWKATEDATTYRLGHEDTDNETRWAEYTVTATDANCVIGDVCSYKPQDSQFVVGDEKAWWVKPKINSEWKDWSSTHVFKIIADNHNSTSAKTVLPKGVITASTPTFKWTPGNGASEYQFGMENFDSSNWVEYIVSANQANCSSTECSFKPNDLKLSNGDQKTWWVRENISGTWGNWSKGSDFLVDINTAYIPFKNQNNVTNIIEVNGKWYGVSNNKYLIKDDGVNNITTLYTAPIKIEGELSKSISGKLYFKVSVSKGSTAHNNNYGRGSRKAVISLTLANNAIKTELSDTNATIAKSMHNFLIVARYHRPGGRAPSYTTYYKIDKNSKLIEIGNSIHGRRFSIVSTDTVNNELIVKQRNGGRSKSFKVTDKVGIGLEELTPFKDMPNVSHIVFVNNAWYAIDSTRTHIFMSDGINDSVSVYETEAEYKIKEASNETLTAKINANRLLFVVQTSKPHQPKGSFILFNTKTKTAKKIKEASTTTFNIIRSMGAYALVATRYYTTNRSPTAPRWSSRYSKIDRDGNIISLPGKVGSTIRFKSVDDAKNEVYFSQEINGKFIDKKITKAVNIGLEDL